MKEKRGWFYLLSGLIFGLGTGIVVAWVLAPIQFIDTSPASLRVDFKDEYRFMVAAAYGANHDLLRAQSRLGTLGDPNPIKALGAQAQRMLASGSPMEAVELLAELSSALQMQPTLILSPTSTSSPTFENTLTPLASPTNPVSATPLPISPTPTLTVSATTLQVSGTASISATPTSEETLTPLPTPIASLPPRPSPTITATLTAPFKAAKQSSFCDPTQPGLLKINLTNAAGKPAAGIELTITWSNGEEHFFTGFKPELGYGYADYKMADQIEYTITLSDGATRVTGLRAAACKNPQGSAYIGGISLEFKQP